MATVHSERQACSGSAPKLDRGQRSIFVRGQGEAVLALRKLESKEEGQRERDRCTETERERKGREEEAREE